MRIAYLNLLFLLTLAWGCGEAIEPLESDPEVGLEFSGKSDSPFTSAEIELALKVVNRYLPDDVALAEFEWELDQELDVRAARNIAAFRAGDDGSAGTADDQMFESIEALDAIPWVGPHALRGILNIAIELGYTASLEKPERPTIDVSYRNARQAMFSQIDNRDGVVTGVYTGMELYTSSIPDHTVMNTEHTWPRSLLTDWRAETDLHHLFPTKSQANSKRSSFPFGNVINATWSEGGSKLGTDVHGQIVFEVRPEHRGNVARAMFYVSMTYDHPLDQSQEDTLRLWHVEDPVDEAERRRNDSVELVQGNRNPYIDNPESIHEIADF